MRPIVHFMLAPARPLQEILLVIVESIRVGASRPALFHLLTVEFALTSDDARFVLERVKEGLRAERGRISPDEIIDPIAWLAYQVACGDVTVIGSDQSEAWHELLSTLRDERLDAGLTFARSPDFVAHATDVERATLAW